MSTDSTIAQVAVEQTTYSFDKPYGYLVPGELTHTVRAGSRVLVPFGRANRKRVGVVVSVAQEAPQAGIKLVAALLDREPLLTDEMLKLGFWLKEHTFCTLYEAFRLMLPAGINLRVVAAYRVAQNVQEEQIAALGPDEQRIVRHLADSCATVERERLLEVMGLSADSDIPERLVSAGLLVRTDEAVRRMGDATVKTARLIVDGEELETQYAGLTPKQKQVIDLLVQAGAASVKEIGYFTGLTAVVVRALEKKNLVELYDEEVYRRPPGRGANAKPAPIVLNDEQTAAYQGLLEDYRQKTGRTSLLYGITGSGKTSIYLKLIEQVAAQGRGVIVMVPEISLTPQTIALFQERFGDRVAVFHSGLSLGQRMDEWKRTVRGEATIAVGTRSAVFAPIKDLGLIVMDEEQEHTYKAEASPRFHARDVARFRVAWNKALLLLASATPSVETFSRAQRGDFGLYKLTQRYGRAVLPCVQTVDMRGEAEAGNTTAFSSVLCEALEDNLANKQQSILLLNRRGYSTFVSCRSCGHVVTCPNCSVSLTYHTANSRMMCHYCGYTAPLIKTCPSCSHTAIRYAGAGTQKAEDQLAALFPQARILRMDADTTMSRFSHEKKFSAFERGEYDIMIGTQMVAKGLDFPNVTLVGVLNADQALFCSDFRSYERAFALLTQVVGRAGRSQASGRAIIQTLVPDNDLIRIAVRQDYDEFYQQEILTRRVMEYPPYCDIAIVGFSCIREEITQRASMIFLEEIKQQLTGEYADVRVRVLGPVPATVARAAGRYRFRILIKCRNNRRFRKLLSEMLVSSAKNKEFRDVAVYADINGETFL